MYNGRHASSAPSGGEKRRSAPASPSRGSMGKRKLGLILALVLLLTVAGGGTLAWLTANSTPVENQMVPGEVPISVVESFENGIKSSVTIENIGNVPAYIRVTVTSNAVDKDGNLVPGNAPTFAVDTTKWTQIGNYYYYNGVVEPGQSTAELFNGPVTVTGGRVDIVAQSIQALGGLSGDGTAETDAWGVTATENADGTVTWSASAPTT